MTRTRGGIAAAVGGLAVLVLTLLGVVLPLGRPVAVHGGLDPARAHEAITLAQVHQDDPLTRRLTMTYDVRPVDPEKDGLPLACDDEADAAEALIVTGRGFWFLPVTRTLVGCGGMSTL